MTDSRESNRIRCLQGISVAKGCRADQWMQINPQTLIRLCELGLEYLDSLDRRDGLRPAVHADIALRKGDIQLA